MGMYGERMAGPVIDARRASMTVHQRARRDRWTFPGLARVIHPDHGTVVVPAPSKLSAILNAAEVWRCNWLAISDAQVWAAEPGDVPEKIPF